MKSSKITALLATTIFAGSLGIAAAQTADGEPASLVNRDADGDGMISQQEYMDGNSEDFSRFDADEDGVLSEDELGESGMDMGDDWDYSSWDSDGDGSLSEDEYGEGMFTMADEDEDGMLNESEQEFLSSVRGSDEISQ